MKLNGGIIPFFGKRKRVLYRENIAELIDHINIFNHNDRSLVEELEEALEHDVDVMVYVSWEFEWFEHVFFVHIKERVYMKYAEEEQNTTD